MVEVKNMSRLRISNQMAAAAASSNCTGDCFNI